MGTFHLHADLNELDGDASRTEAVMIRAKGEDANGRLLDVQVIGADGMTIFDTAKVAVVAGVLDVDLPANDNAPGQFGYVITRPAGVTRRWQVPVQAVGVTVELASFTSSSPLPMTPTEGEAAAVALAAETTRATAAEATKVNTSTYTAGQATQDTALAAETTRATAAEATKVNSSTYTAGQATQDAALASETSRAQTAEAAAVTTAAADATTKANAAQAAAATDATTKVAAETTRATTAEGTKVDTSTYTAGQAAQDTALSAETTRATAAEGANTTAIATEATTARAAELAEVTRATAAEAAIQAQVATFAGAGVFRGTWAAGSYVQGDIVLYSGLLYGASGAAVSSDTPGVAAVWVALPTTVDSVARAAINDPTMPHSVDVGTGALIRFDAADGTSTWLQANDTDGGPTAWSTAAMKTALGVPSAGIMATNDTRVPQILDTVSSELVRIDAADGSATWLQASAADGGPTAWAMSLIQARLAGAGSTYGLNLAAAGLDGTTADVGALINAQYGLGFRHLIVPYRAAAWPSLSTFTVPTGCMLEYEPGARIANNMSGTGGAVVYGTLVNPSFTSTSFSVPSSSAHASSNDYAYPSRETLFCDGARVLGDYYHEYAVTGAHCVGADIVFLGNIHGKNMRHRTGWGQVFHIDADSTNASQIWVLGRIYGEDSDRNVEIEDGAHDVHILGGGYAKNIFPNGYTGQPTGTGVGDHAVYANYTFVWDMGHAHDFSGTGGATYAGPQRIFYKGVYVSENSGGALTCIRSVGTSATTIPRDNSMDELHIIGRGQSTGAEDVSLGGINCRVGRVVLSEGAGITGGVFRVKQLSTGSNNRVGEVTGTTAAMAALTISDDATGFKVGGSPTQQWP